MVALNPDFQSAGRGPRGGRQLAPGGPHQIGFKDNGEKKQLEQIRFIILFLCAVL